MSCAILIAVGEPRRLPDAKHRRYKGLFLELYKSLGLSATPRNIVFNRPTNYCFIDSKLATFTMSESSPNNPSRLRSS